MPVQLDQYMLDLAHTMWMLHDMRAHFVPRKFRSKSEGIPWKPYAQREPTPDEIRTWIRWRSNLALIMAKDFVAVDFDSKETAEQGRNRLPPTEMWQDTPNGVHLIYRYPSAGTDLRPTVKVKVSGVLADLRIHASYILIAPSVHPAGKPYIRRGTWNLIDVPEFDPSWVEDAKQEHLRGEERRELTRGRVRNVDGYLAKIESVQGQGGSRGLVRAAAVCRDAGLPESAAMRKLMVWNAGQTVKPAWSLEELARAVTRVYGR